MRIQIILTAMVILTMASCSKIIETAPSHQLDANQRFQNLSDYEDALVGVYSLFQQADYYGDGSNAYVGLPDMISDNVNETGESLGNFTVLSSWVYAEDEPNISNTWQSAYKIISQANLVLRGIDTFFNSEPERVNRIKGQALALRAMVHFDVMRYWAEEFDRNSSKPGIPYISEFNYELKPSRGTIAETYDKIEADLLLAKQLLQNIDLPINESGRAYVDDIVVDAMLARMYLYSGEYDNAIEHATSVIDQIPLESLDVFPSIWLDETTEGVVWSLVFNAGEGRIGDNIYFVPSDRSSYEPNPTLLSLYDPSDIRLPTYYKVESGRIILSKYLSKGSMSSRPDGVVDFKVFRTAEMYLIRAEAFARSGQEGLALDDLNVLRSARIQDFVPGNETGAALLDAIELERRKELIAEGHRFFDLKRTSRMINRTDCPNFCTLEPGDRAWAFPIPIGEINANPNIIPQNPGY